MPRTSAGKCHQNPRFSRWDWRSVASKWPHRSAWLCTQTKRGRHCCRPLCRSRSVPPRSQLAPVSMLVPFGGRSRQPRAACSREKAVARAWRSHRHLTASGATATALRPDLSFPPGSGFPESAKHFLHPLHPVLACQEPDVSIVRAASAVRLCSSASGFARLVFRCCNGDRCRI